MRPFSNYEKKLAKKLKIFKNCFLPIFFWKSKLLNLKKSFENEAISQFSFLFLVFYQLNLSVCFAFPAYLQSCNSSIKQAHVWIWDTQKRQNWKYRTPILRCSSYKRNIFLRHYFWGHLVQCWEKVFNIILEYKYQTCFIQILSNDAGLFESVAA